jgi:hypothetical protein
MVFTSCGKDEEEDNLLTPAQAVDNLAFTDTDLAELKIGGTLSWQLPDPETNIDGYVIYISGSATTKDTKLGTAPKGATSFIVPDGTAYNIYLLVVAQNAVGESTNIASISISDSSGTDEPEEPEVPPHNPETTGAFILNRGNWNENNASLSYYNLKEQIMIPNVYKTVNGKGLGDSAEQLLVYGSKTYITVTTSNRLLVLDEAGKEIKELNPKNAANEPLNPRRMVAANGKVYVSYYYGHALAALDTASLEIEKTVPVGRYPEYVAVAGGKIYVANSGGLDSETGYGKTVSVVNAETFRVEKEIEVVINPVNLTADSQGDLYLISMGNYGDVPNTLQRIDGQTGEVSVLGNASTFSLVNDKLYAIYAQYGDPNVTYKRYNVLTETVDVENFITDGTTFSYISAFAVDPLNEKLYIADTAYGSTSTLFIFSPDGKKEKELDTEGFDAHDIVFTGNYDK